MAKLGKERVLVVAAQVEEPLECIQYERFHAPDRQGAGAFAGGSAPHAVSDDYQDSLFVGEQRLVSSLQAGLVHLHRLGEPSDQEMILVGDSDSAVVGQGTEPEPYPRRIALGDSLVLLGRVVERGMGVLERHCCGPPSLGGLKLIIQENAKELAGCLWPGAT